MTTTLTDPPAPTAPNPHDALKGILGPGLRVQAFATMVDVSPTFDIDVLTSCIASIPDEGQRAQATLAVNALSQANAHLATAKTHGVTWRTVILPAMFDTNTGIQSYGVALQSVLTDLQTKQKALPADATSEQKIAFLQVALPELNALEKVAETYAANAKNLADQLNTLVTDLSTDVTNFTQDNTTIQNVVGGESGLITSLGGEITACHDAIKKDIAMIVGGAAATLVGIGMCVAGALIVAGTLGAGAPVAAGLIIGGVIVTGGGVALMTIGGKDLHAEQEELANATTELDAVQGAVTSFNGCSSVLGHLVDGATDAHAAATQLGAMWDDERSKLTSLAQTVGIAISSADPSCLDVLGLFVTSALEDWSPVAELSNDIDQALTGLSNSPVNLTAQVPVKATS